MSRVVRAVTSSSRNHFNSRQIGFCPGIYHIQATPPPTTSLSRIERNLLQDRSGHLLSSPNVRGITLSWIERTISDASYIMLDEKDMNNTTTGPVHVPDAAVFPPDSSFL